MGSTSEQMISDVELKDLFRKAMKGELVEVVEKYKSDPRAHKAKITKSGDTALHIAVSDGTFVDELKEEQYDNDYQPTDQSSNEEKNRNFPENYTACLDFFLPVIHGVRNGLHGNVAR
ncbi:hypothetical protein CJ030_MR1G014933 [Morella rubra]|uniref:Uncharacterized protein n=1 Tax=Morella rubra TaxID=262757 RepID=A0A6A1WNY4_9ROSI|nr:hypothetical protein CJ030_MR1G014933 [Morella rubra]